MKNKIIWEYREGTKICAPLYYFEDYVISIWSEYFILSYRPTGQHIPLGKFNLFGDAKEAAEKHQKTKFSIDNKSVKI